MSSQLQFEFHPGPAGGGPAHLLHPLSHSRLQWNMNGVTDQIHLVCARQGAELWLYSCIIGWIWEMSIHALFVGGVMGQLKPCNWGDPSNQPPFFSSVAVVIKVNVALLHESLMIVACRNEMCDYWSDDEQETTQDKPSDDVSKPRAGQFSNSYVDNIIRVYIYLSAIIHCRNHT